MSSFEEVLKKKAFIGGNWKCNGTISQRDSIVTLLNNAGPFPTEAEVVIAVPSVHILAVKETLRSDVLISSQDIAVQPGFGAYTGEISAAILSDIGIKWAIIGHSERRTGFGFPGEPDSVVAAKVKTAVTSGIKAIACIGEQLSERENGTTFEVLSTQLSAIAAQLTPSQWKDVVIAYEPVWAIGTGKVATPEQAEETHLQIRGWIQANVSPEVANEIRIIYGGSVKGNNALSLIKGPNIDGFLVGGASLLPEFIDIIKSAEGFYNK
mmetsp:Transcript_21647/g.19711  ORF Transcript_21647/g.19711 Transcript_21647/m.19711 type:complete len:267 (-) Transcript_21647:101-901(-)|eukprot:CAMPEP_0196767628 /NCGR_PEP_ID=MMETSP1095-20130614/41802_1 /TAXON_ID=96789 ORGANISM="Chromulina nebulosa, Strain UTEXLB2642" /NCGR_SAMPLE_ID=MMETSP1095 /ASSEMBLY_ACC=CAM_ASM_000446 /LENGTH=266 /DNA_ID=CAMNT_0042136119 /DNA_START=78 /DNA_END=878 /DNA_ORIENTATION=+